VEPWLERVIDLSFHGAVDGSEVRFDGVSRMLTDRYGRFQGSLLGPFDAGASGLGRWFSADGRDARWLDRVAREVVDSVGVWLGSLRHQGPFGVDAFVHRLGGLLRLHPLVEVNPRWTFGRVALGLHRRLAPGARGALLTLASRSPRPAPEVALDDLGRVRRAFLPLGDEPGPVAALLVTDFASFEAALASMFPRSRLSSGVYGPDRESGVRI
jgi:hypothetical protein